MDRLAIDVINGWPALREWVEDGEAMPGELEAIAGADEVEWRDVVRQDLLY